jgi:hypothetical protein
MSLPLRSPLHTERIRRKQPLRISPRPNLLQMLILRLVFVVSEPHLVQVPITVRAPQHPLVLLAEAAVRSNKQLVVLCLPGVGGFFVLGLVEAVEHLADCRVAPAVGCAVGGVGVEFGGGAAEALDLHGEPAVSP